jgi:hypothetical protein
VSDIAHIVFRVCCSTAAKLVSRPPDFRNEADARVRHEGCAP